MPPTPVPANSQQPTARLPFAVVEMNRPVTDPVCGRSITRATAKSSLDHAEGSVSFCSTACRELYPEAPRRP